VICGDLNVARTDRDVHPKERKLNAIGQRSEERDLLERVLGRSLVDVGRALEPEKGDLFTWWAPWRNLRQRNIGWRLDYVLATENLRDPHYLVRCCANSARATTGPWSRLSRIEAWKGDPR
jgi:exodeoxyribonuclease III